jgi:hypothetical protein
VEEVDQALAVAAVAVHYLYHHQLYHQVQGPDLLQGEPPQHHHLLHLLQVAADPQLFFLLTTDYHKLQMTNLDLLGACCPH